jgi:ketosteroid isomerase-like protein
VTLEIRDEAIAGLWEYRGGPRFFADAGTPVTTDAASQARARAIAEEAFVSLQRGLIGDSGALSAFIERLDEGVHLWFPPTPNTRSPYVGRASVERVFREVIVPMYPAGLFVRRFHTLTGGHRTAFELQSYGVRRDGSEYINSPMLALDVQDDRVVRIWEHWGGPGYFDRALRVSSIEAPAV